MSDLELSKASLKKGSKTFSLAAKLFNHNQMEAAAHIYHWCRYCDDVVDEKIATKADWDELVAGTFYHSDRPEFRAFKSIRERYQIPDLYPQELLEGMRMDMDQNRYQTFEELNLYCYRVASTVGLMMSHVMGLYKEEALKEAAHLGMAMQLTNIARDVKEDLARDRIYLPQAWLKEAGISSGNLLSGVNRQRLMPVIKKLLSEAERFYDISQLGIKELPWQSALAVTLAKNLYREIGREILRRGERALDTRVVVSPFRKAWVILITFIEVVSSVPHRLKNKRSIQPIRTTWRYV